MDLEPLALPLPAAASPAAPDPLVLAAAALLPFTWPAMAPLAAPDPLALAAAALLPAVNRKGGDSTSAGFILDDERRAELLPVDLRTRLAAGARENRTVAVRMGLLPPPAAAAPLPLADPLAGDPAASASLSPGKNISMTPTMPWPWGRIIRIWGLPSSEVPKVT